jgi:hypothetical protein
MKGSFMEKINQSQAITELIEVGTASEITLGGDGNRYESIQGDHQWELGKAAKMTLGSIGNRYETVGADEQWDLF